MGNEHVDELMTLGLSSYEASAYAALVEHGVMTAEAVADEADVPLGRIYDVLNSLADRTLVQADDGRPRTYTHVDPTVAIERLLERRQSELETKRSEYERTASSVRQTLRELSDREDHDQFATSALHARSARDLLLERFEAASASIRLFIDEPDFEPAVQEAFVEALTTVATSDVTVRLLGSTAGMDRTAFERLQQAGVRVRQTDDDPHHQFIVIDELEVCVEVLDPVDAKGLLALVNVREEAVASDLATEFDEYWRRAGPGF